MQATATPTPPQTTPAPRGSTRTLAELLASGRSIVEEREATQQAERAKERSKNLADWQAFRATLEAVYPVELHPDLPTPTDRTPAGVTEVVIVMPFNHKLAPIRAVWERIGSSWSPFSNQGSAFKFQVGIYTACADFDHDGQPSIGENFAPSNVKYAATLEEALYIAARRWPEVEPVVTAQRTAYLAWKAKREQEALVEETRVDLDQTAA